jgi:hypothetical protein
MQIFSSNLYLGYTGQGSRFLTMEVKKLNKNSRIGLWFSPGNPASSTTKTGLHDIVEILLKKVLKHQKSIDQLFWYNICIELFHCYNIHKL